MSPPDITSIRRPDPPLDETAIVPSPRVDDDLTRVVSRDDLETRVITRISAAQSTAQHPYTPTSFATLSPLQADPGTLPGTPQHPGDIVAKQVGRYLVLEKLGRGGMASVFKAHDPSIGRDVAIKFLHSALCEDEEYRGRFLREARAAGGLSHANIVTVHDVGEIEGRPYMAMELLKGQPLAELMDAAKTLPIRDVVIIGIQLARALDYAHSRGIVHRDIKPGNIALLEGTNTIKVMDFGIAHMDAGGGADQHTRVGDVLGTPQYMSPEQTRGEKLDGRSDLFSVGIMLYQMLSGQRPFQGGSMVAIAMKIAQDQPPGLDKLRPEIPSGLRRIVERCLAKAPDQRFQNGRELSDALTRVLAQLDEAAREKAQPRIIPLRVKWAVTMGLIVAVVMGLVATIVTKRQYAAMIDQVSESGAGLARFIAAQNAEPALRGDQWQTVDFSVQRMMETGDFQSITIVDNRGIVRAASDPALLDKAFTPPQSQALVSRSANVQATRFMVGGESVLGFEAPITYAGKDLGKVLLGLKESPLTHVAHLSMSLMGILVVVTVLAVAVAMFFVANWFAQPIKVVTEALDEIARGHVEYRIAETRKDEFGLLFAAFDRMAQAIQDARSGISVAAKPQATAELADLADAAPTTDATQRSDAS